MTTDRDELIDRLYRAHNAAAASIAEFGVPDGELEDAVERVWSAVCELGPDPEADPGPAAREDGAPAPGSAPATAADDAKEETPCALCWREAKECGRCAEHCNGGAAACWGDHPRAPAPGEGRR